MKRIAKLGLLLFLLVPSHGHAGPLKWIRGKMRQAKVNRVLVKAGLDAPRKWGISTRGHILPGGAVLSPMSEVLGSVRSKALGLARTASRIDVQGNGVVFRGNATVLGTLLNDRTTGRITLTSGNDQWQVRLGRQQAAKEIEFSTGRKVSEQTVKVIHKQGGQQVSAMRERVIRDTVTKRGAAVTDVVAASQTDGRQGYHEYSDSATSVRRYGAVWLSGCQNQKQCYVVEDGRIRMTGKTSNPTVKEVLNSPFDLSKMKTPNADRAAQMKVRARQEREWKRRMREDYRINGA
jgi:hypothetical protein